MKPFGLEGLVFFACLLAGAASAQNRPESRQGASVAIAPVPPEAGAEYVGEERCRSCHRAEATQFAKTPHASLKIPGPNPVTGCEMCHGPGKKHADGEAAAQGDETKSAAAAKLIYAYNANPKDIAEHCLRCHQSNRDQKDFTHSTHLLHGVSCNRCHAMHLVEAARTPKATELGTAQGNFFNVAKLPEDSRWLHNSQLTRPQPQLCFECHTNVQAQFALPTHHRVPEGLMNCTDCHNTHGTSNRASLRQVGWETCTQCHNEKRGPFVFEHSAVKVEGCTICHVPHGSVNRMLLQRREERFLCLACHIDPFAANVPHGRLSFQTRGDCTRCHSSIHGSNFDPNFLH
jgi:predicted CXXCH cytochrome family protein